MKRKSNVTKIKKRRTINVGHIVFLIIFIYIAINFYLYLTKDHLTVYKVREGQVAQDNTYNGLILRREEVYNTNQDGYIYYYNKDGDRIPKNSAVYTITQNENSTSLVNSEFNTASLDEDGIAKVNKEIGNFHNDYSNSNFSTVYDFKHNLNNLALDIINEQNQNSLEEFLNDNVGDSFQVSNSLESGIITYYIDNYETLLATDITYEHFNMENYKRNLLRKDTMFESGAPAYKLVTDSTWEIIIPLSSENYNYLQEQEEGSIQNVTIRFVDDDLVCPGTFSYFQNGDEYFGQITLDYYMEKYANQRFIDIELNIDAKTGLKIPTSSIIEKDFYLIPHAYFTKGGDSNEEGLILETYDSENELALTFSPTEIFYEDEDYAYVNTLAFEPNSWIRSESGERLKLDEKASLKGVYNVNKGYAVFRRIEVIEESEEYTIVEEGTSYGLSEYDQISLYGDLDIEEQIIY